MSKLEPIAQPVFRWPIQIYWEDTDAGGVVYHSNYLKYFERTRSEWLRHKGVVQTDLVKLHQVVFVVRAANQQFLKPARMDEQLEVWLAPHDLGRASLSVRHELRRIGPKAGTNADTNADVLNRAEIALACVDATSFAPARIPPFLYELFASEQQN
jgi:acyl-CoA thioester hydrolase